MGKKSSRQMIEAEQLRAGKQMVGAPGSADQQTAWDLRPLALKGWNQAKYIAPPGGDAYPAVAHTTTRVQRLVTLHRKSAGEALGFEFETTDPYDPGLHHEYDDYPYANTISSVTPGSLAHKAGLRPDDVLVSVNGMSTISPVDQHGPTHQDVLAMMQHPTRTNTVQITFDRDEITPWARSLNGPVWFSITETQIELLASHSEIREVLLTWELANVRKFAHKDGVLGVELEGEGSFFFSMMNTVDCSRTLGKRLLTGGGKKIVARKPSSLPPPV